MFKQITDVLMTHIYTVVIGTVMGFMFMTWLIDKPIGYTIFSAVFTLIYFSAIYSKAWECAERDKKPFTPTSVYLFKGAVLSVGILVFNVVLWAAYLFAWRSLTIDGAMVTATGIIYNVLYVINTFMYSGFVKITQGVVPWQAHLIIMLVPLVASTIGYIAGVKNFTLSDKLMPFIYEKKKTKE
ncbi:MAG: hypothetical protein IJ366_08740 [Clostridia bacterium]|nr:hypothetical protein [Clostridia bacterium]